MTAGESCRRIVAQWADAPLLTDAAGAVVLQMRDGAIPRLVAWTHEDKAAKGLRKLAADAAPRPPVHFTVAEMIQDTPALLLTGEAGSGRTVLARDLAMRLARAHVGSAWTDGGPVDRNDLGDDLPETWAAPLPHPVLLSARADASLAEHAAEAGEDLSAPGPMLVILDDLERAGAGAADLLAQACAWTRDRTDRRLLALADTAQAAGWPLPAGCTRLALVPLLVAQRRRFVAAHPDSIGTVEDGAFGPAAGNAALFALALVSRGSGATEEEIVADWLAGNPGEADRLCAEAVACLADPHTTTLPFAARPQRVRQFMAARALAGDAPADLAARFASEPALWAPVLASLLRVADTPRQEALAAALVTLPGEASARGALLAAACVCPGSAVWTAVQAALMRIVETGALTPRLREDAGRILSARGDPRDLEALVSVPGGTFVMGAPEPPNSVPPHPVAVRPFRIGIYPVTNGLFARFVAETGRTWKSPEQGRPERLSAPATDLTWRDARAYCAWLTGRWRAEGRIVAGEVVRLPTEAEWERAARGDQTGEDGATVYPWAGPWNPDAVNGEETGFNDTCTVGLFPAGRSPYGCLDMAGQVWEWVSTLWGEDMAKPSFAYPYRDDGREDPDADPGVRRGLRGGCFSSGAPKACCTYRGSLEPDGFWRGNGFRVVVAKA